MNLLLALIGAGSAGMFLAIGASANARLKQSLQSAIAAATINFIVGFSCLTLLIAIGAFNPPQFDRLPAVPWWVLGGGLLGATFVTLNTLVIPRLGLTTTTLAVVCSQMVMSLVIDQFGWFGITSHPVSMARVIAIGLLFLAIVLTQLDHKVMG